MRARALSALLVAVCWVAGCSVAVPDLSGLDLEQATTRLERVDLIAGEITYDPESPAATWTVIEHSAPDRLKKGSAVDLVLAGAPPVTVPDIKAESAKRARRALERAGLAIGEMSEEYHERIPSEHVISQSPSPGESVPEGMRVALVISAGKEPPPSANARLRREAVLGGNLSPKSVVASQSGYVFAQNMMYRHTVSVFDVSKRELLKTIDDDVVLADFGFKDYPSRVRGAPVEAAVSADGTSMYVSNYSMYGPGFSRPGDDVGGPQSGVDDSFVYRIPFDTLEIDQVIKVGAVPKYLAATPDGRYLLVSNWISYTVSVVDVESGKELRQIRVGRYPRGIAITSDARFAYVAVMGSTGIERIDLRTFETKTLSGIGMSPRHLVISPDDRFLYATLNGSGEIAKIELPSGKVIKRLRTGTQPRSMTSAPDGQALYVVNYESDSVSKVLTEDMTEVQELPVGRHPIGITYVNDRQEVWVACYSGNIYVFEDR